MNRKIGRSVFFILFELFAILFFLRFFLFSFPEKVDGLVAVVNNQPITVTDLRIVKTFGLYDLTDAGERELLVKSVLDNLVNQKLVQQFIKEDINVDKKDINRLLANIKETFKSAGFEEKLDLFGMTLEELKDYCAEYLFYKKIISDRFSRSVVINLKEIEEYYDQVYVPQQKDQGEIVKQMVDILPEIESAVKEKKTRVQVGEWIKNLRSQAEIRIRLERYINFIQDMEK
jgi:hypothetical protein